MEVREGRIRCLKYEEESASERYEYVVLQPYELSLPDGRQIVVPRGFLTDGSSGGPDCGASWVFHDYLYATHAFTSGEPCTREEADAVMSSVLAHEGRYGYCRVFVKLSWLNPFWLFSSAWEKSGTRGPEFLRSGSL